MLMADTQFTTEELANEIWKDVVGYEGVYSVSNLGRVRRDLASRGSRPNYILKPSPTSGGYLNVTIRRLQRIAQSGVHILVCRAFHGEPPAERSDVNHKDLDKTNNRANNLEWMTRSENVLHSHANDNHPRGEKRPFSKLKDADIPTIRARIASGEPVARIARDYGVGDHTIHRIKKGLKWKHIP